MGSEGARGMSKSNTANSGELHYLSLRAHRLVVIEWLGDEPKTGSELVRHLHNQSPTLPIQLFSCQSKSDVLNAIAQTESEVPSKGVPILHIEAHGLDIHGDGVGFKGPGLQTSERSILWDDLQVPFRSLNIATGFNLAVVAAACLSEGVLFTIEHDEAAPFVLVVALMTLVSWSNLESAMMTFYSEFLVKKADFLVAFRQASTCLSPSERIGFTPVVRLVRATARHFAESYSTKDKFEENFIQANIERALAGKSKVSRSDVLRVMDERTLSAAGRLVSTILAYQSFPQNRSRFRVDGRIEARKALKERRWMP